jgi:tRNA (guanine37-N1)-methyltransferase
MRIDIISVLPGLLESPFNHSILKRAQENNLVDINVVNLRDYAKDKHKTVDDYAYGGGSGMVMMIEPIAECIDSLRSTREYDEVIFMAPDGDQLNQKMANQLSLAQNIIILCGHYKGVDQRVRDHYITREISIGDYVLTGGELPAAILCDTIIRLIPGVISDETSALTDSYQDDLLAPPVFTRPEVYEDKKVPSVLLSGNEAEIIKWRQNQAIIRTKEKRPGLLDEK